MFRNMFQMKSQLRKDQSSNISILVADSVDIQTAIDFEHIQVNVTNKISVSALRQQVDALQARINQLHVEHKRRSAAQAGRYETLAVKRLWIRNSSFTNVLLKSQPMHLAVPIEANVLRADQMHLFDEMDANTTAGSARRRRQANNPSGLTTIGSLTVNMVNGIDWNEFIASLYLRNSQQRIDGNLIVTRPCAVEQISTAVINDIPVTAMFTLNTPQVVGAQVLFAHIVVPQLFANWTNGIRFGVDTVMTTAGETVIEGPVDLQRCTIDQLTLAASDLESTLARHIVGTHLKDLSQIYTGTVTINGSLRLANVVLERPRKSPVFVNDQQFGVFEVAQRFWMKSTDQTIPTAVAFAQPLQTSQIFVTETINAHPIGEHLLTIAQPNAPTVNLVFDAATIDGNLYTDRQYTTTVAQLNEECVRRQDTSPVRVLGRKRFEGQLTVDHFASLANNFTAEMLPVSRAELLGQPLQLNCVKQFAQLSVLGGSVRVLSELLDVATLNGVDLHAGMPNMVRIHEATTLDELAIDGAALAGSVVVSQLGNIELDQIFRRMADGTQLRELHVFGGNSTANSDDATTTTFDELQVGQINGIDVDEYLARVVTTHGPEERLIRGVKHFQSAVTVNDLQLRHLNELDVEEWMSNAMQTERPQRFTGQWQIGSLEAETIYAPAINAVPLDSLIDATQDVIELQSDISVANAVNVAGDVIAAHMDCDLTLLRETLQAGAISRLSWRQIEINGQATWPDAADGTRTPINRLLTNGVTSNTAQLISGDVRFQHGRVVIANLSSQPPINDINVLQIVDDALLNIGDYQLMRSAKRFVNGVSLQAAAIAGDLRTPLWNGCDLLQLNATLVRTGDGGDRSISGVKRFAHSPSVHGLKVLDDRINGIPVADIVRSGAEDDAMRPARASVILSSGAAVVGRLDIGRSLNFMPLDVFMTQRVLLGSTQPQDVRGVLTFERLVVHGGQIVGTINQIPIGSMVMRSSDTEQALHGRKSIVGGVVRLNGPVALTHLNGVDLVHAHEQSVRLDADVVQLQRLNVLNNISMVPANGGAASRSADDAGSPTADGFTVLGDLNDVDMMSLMYWQPPTARDLLPIQADIGATMQRAEDALQAELSAPTAGGGGGQVAYLDYASDLRIKFVKELTTTAAAAAESHFVDTHVACDSGVNQTTTAAVSAVGQCFCPVQNVIVAPNRYQVLVAPGRPYERTVRLCGHQANFTIHTRFPIVSCDVGGRLAANMVPATRQTTATVQWRSADGMQHESTSTLLAEDGADGDDEVRGAVRLFEQNATTLILGVGNNGTVRVWQWTTSPADEGGERAQMTNLGRIEYGQRIEHLCVLSWHSYNLLLALAGANGGQLFYFDGAAFRPLANGAIAGDYDRCATATVLKTAPSSTTTQPAALMLWLGRSGSDALSVYRTVHRQGWLRKFELLQTVVVAEGPVNQVLTLPLLGKSAPIK